MKIALFDPYLLKFTAGMIKWWVEHGYEVRYERYYNPALVKWADIVWFFTCDNNLSAATMKRDNPDFDGYDMHEMDLTGKKIIVQPIDIEIWQGHQHASKWDLVDDVIFIADHIRDVCEVSQLPERKDDLRIHTIPFSVDLDRWTFKKRKPGFDIAVVSERWISKGTDLILQVALKLQQIDKRYKIHWLGQRSGEPWDLDYFDDFIAHNKLNIEITNILNDGRNVDEFLEDKNYLLHGSHKEAFSAATAEAMAKGIKPVIHRFYGADALWPGITWSSIDEAVGMITGGDYNSHDYRSYLINQGYTLPQMMERYEEVIHGKSDKKAQ